MKNLSFLRHLVFCCLMLMGTALPALTWAVTINGDINVCKGETNTYTPATTLNPDYSYTWTVTPAANGTVLSGNSLGANIQWNIVGPATINLTGRDPSLPGNPIVETGTLNVTVHNLPTPYITANVMLACQPLNVDSIIEGQPRPPQFDDERCQLVCSYSTVVYTANGTAGSTYTWNITGAISFTASGNTCTVNWGAPGNGHVSVTETTTFGCQAPASFCVEIVESPIAKFESVPPSPDPITICKDGEVVVQDMSTGSTASPLVSWRWDWGDGQITTTSAGGALNPISHQYTVPGNYTIKLTVTNSCGCTSTFARRVRVLAPVAPKIACPRVVCEDERSVYSVDIPCAASSWSVIGGTIISTTPNRLEVAWNSVDPNTGFGYVMYRACNPCPMTVVEPVPVVLRRANIQGPVVICVGEQYVYRLPKWPTTEFDWYIVSGPAILQPTDQRNEKALTATGPGTVVLGCKWRNTVLGCGGETQLTIQVLAPAVITGDDLFCQGETRSYNIGGLSGSWTLMNATNSVIATGTGTTFNYTFNIPGTYKLGVTGTTFCPPEQFILKVVPTPAPPNVVDGPDSACANIPTLYEAGNPIPNTSFQWSVSSGTVNAALGDESYITFAGAPPYTISVRRITLDEAQCLSSPLNKIVVSPVPTLVITGEDTACHSTQEAYLLNYGGGDVYGWTISPSTLGSVVQNGNTNNPTILWNIPPGTGQLATITAKVTKCGMDNFKTFTVFVRGTPTINVTLAAGQNDTVCSGTPITFTVNPSYPINSATSTNWQWGDGPLVSTPGFTSGPPYNFTHTYITDGNAAPVGYTPSVTIIDANGCLGSVTGTAPAVTVMPRPIAVVSPSGPLVHCGTGWTETLTATVTTGIGGSNTFNWSPSGVGTSITTGSYGNYSVTVSNSIFGCSSTSNVVSIIQNCIPPGCGTPPTITLNATKNCNAINVTASVVGATTGYSWSYSPGVTPVGIPTAGNLNATVNAAGIYTFGYTVFYMSGTNACQYTQNINVTVPYLPDLRYDISCNQVGSNYKVTLYDHSTLYPPGSPLTRNFYNSSWGLIGSGATATAFVAGGSTSTFYEIIQGGVNPACTSSVSVVVPTFPVANFSLLPGIPNPGCVGSVAFNFNNTSTPTSPPAPIPLSCLWTFGDGSTNMIYNAGKVYSAFYNGPVILKVTDAYGCTNSASVNVTANLNPYSGTITAAPNPVCQGNPVTLTYNPAIGFPSMPTTYTWNEQSNPLFTTAVPTYNVFTPGGYWVKGKGLYGCEVNTNLVSVNVKQVPPISINGDNTQCINSTFKLTTQSITGATYVWTRIGFGTVGTGTFVTQTLATAGSYTYYVTMTYNGCTRVSPNFIVVVSNPPPTPSISFNILNCNPYQVQLTASGVAGTYNWNNGMSGTVINTPFGGPYQVILTALNGCQSDNSIYVPKDPNEYLWVFPTGCFCKLQIERPYVIGPIVPFSYWAWIKNGGVSASGGGYMPNYNVTPGNVYNMVLNNGYCTVTSGDMYFQSDTCNRLIPRPTDLDELEGDGINMLLLPNPAREQVTVMYKFASSGGSRSIEMYDMIGRKLQTHTVTEEKGNIILQLDHVAAGMYQVVMRQDGKVVQQGKLSVTK
jgi:PKD repeat protein